jgi:hypothetical protein
MLGVVVGLTAGCSKSDPSAPEPNSSAASDDTAAAEEVARKVLRAIQQEDGKALIALATERVRRNAEKSPQRVLAELKRAFSQWRELGVQNWDGNLHGVRFSGRGAHVKYGELSADEIAVVHLIWEQGGWRFKDLQSPTPEMWEEGTKAFQPPEEP